MVSTALPEEADLILGMAAEHREEVARLVPSAAGRVFTLKELVRLLEALPAPGSGTTPELADAIALADDLRRKGFEGTPHDEDVMDPLGMPLETYRAIAWELEGWIDRLADLLVGVAPARSAAGSSEG
jgi:protein-tyrosine phosphatase